MLRFQLLKDNLLARILLFVEKYFFWNFRFRKLQKSDLISNRIELFYELIWCAKSSVNVRWNLKCSKHNVIKMKIAKLLSNTQNNEIILDSKNFTKSHNVSNIRSTLFGTLYIINALCTMHLSSINGICVAFLFLYRANLDEFEQWHITF